MPDMSSPAAAIAAALAERAEAVCRHYLSHGRRSGRYWIAGDLHGAVGRSLFVRLSPPGTPGKWQDSATGEHGDLLDLVRIRSSSPTLAAALTEARSFLALRKQDLVPAAHDTVAAAQRLWDRCGPVNGTHAESFLRARGLVHWRFASLRFHPGLETRDGATRLRLPALVAAVTNTDGDLTGVQRTWLDPHSPVKADIATPRKALGRIFGAAVRFGEIRDTLLVGEGIETVLSLVTAVPTISAAAALSAGSLGAFVLPPGLTHLVIARDNDEEGERAAARLKRRCHAAGIAVTVLCSESGDFNDDLVDRGSAVLAERIAPLFECAAVEQE